MEAIRKLIRVRNNVINVVLPENYNNKTVELIILHAEELPSVAEEPKVDYESLYGSLNSGLTADQIDEQLRALRNEWERDIS